MNFLLTIAKRRAVQQKRRCGVLGWGGGGSVELHSNKFNVRLLLEADTKSVGGSNGNYLYHAISVN